MPTYLVGPTRPYTTITAAITAASGSGVHEIVVDPGVYNERVTLGAVSGSWVLRAATGYEAKGVFDSSSTVIIRPTTSGTAFTVQSTSGAIIKDIQITCLNDGGTLQAISTATATGCRFENCLFKCHTNVWVHIGFSASHVFYKCLAWSVESIVSLPAFYNNSFVPVNYVNCGVYGFSGGFGSQEPTLQTTCTNCWAMRNAGQTVNGGYQSFIQIYTASGVTKNNASSDSTAPGSSPVLNLTVATASFINRSGSNFHITSNSVLYGAGSNQSSLFTTDWDLETITTWSIGPDAEGVVVDDEIDGANECPIGQYYAADNFEIDDYVNTNKWSVVTSGGYAVSSGAFHPNLPSFAFPLPELKPLSINLSGAFKIAGEFVAADTGTVNANWFGITINRTSGLNQWQRILAVRGQSNGLQSIALSNAAAFESVSFTNLLTNLPANVARVLAIEYDGISSLRYSVDGVVLFSETIPTGALQGAWIFNGQYQNPNNPPVNTWCLNWGYFWPYSGLGKVACGPTGAVPTTSSSPWINQNDPHDDVDDAESPSLKKQHPSSSRPSQTRTKREDAKVPSLNKRSPETAPSISSGGGVVEPRVQSRQTKKGYRDGFISIMGEKFGYDRTSYDSADMYSGFKVPFETDNLTTGQTFIDVLEVTPSRANRTRVDLGMDPAGGFMSPIRTNDIIPILQSHFQRRIGTTSGVGTTFYQFYPSREAVVMSGSSFGTGSYTSSGTQSAFSVSVYKNVEGSAYHFQGGLCDVLKLGFTANGEGIVSPNFVFKDVETRAHTNSHPFGSYSTQRPFPGHQISLNFLGLPVVSLDLESKNNIKKYRPAGVQGFRHQFGRYELGGQAVVDLSRLSLSHFGSMLGASSFSVYGTLYDGETNKMVFELPNCRLRKYEMNINNTTVTMPFSCYESEDGGTAPITIKLWTRNYSGTSFEPN